ncbi:hypothetical protein GCM10020331_083600 [Ectobacillus funiculus]
MYQLLIADDEPLEREGLELMVQRAMPEQFTIYHAENGRVAIEKRQINTSPILFFLWTLKCQAFRVLRQFL